MDPRVRQLKIKTGIVRRLAKERSVYEKEAEEQKVRLEKAKADPSADEYVVKKHEEVLHEALMMVPECGRRLAKARQDLASLLEAEKELEEREEYREAAQALALSQTD